MNMFDIIEIINTKELLKKKILRYGNPSIYLTDRSWKRMTFNTPKKGQHQTKGYASSKDNIKK